MILQKLNISIWKKKLTVSGTRFAATFFGSKYGPKLLHFDRFSLMVMEIDGRGGSTGAKVATGGVEGEIIEIFFLSPEAVFASPLTGEYFFRPLCMEFPVEFPGEILDGDDLIFRMSGDEFGMLRLIFAFPG